MPLLAEARECLRVDVPGGLNPMTQLLRLPQVMDQVGLRPTRIYELMGDGTFPKPIRLGERAVAWIASEIETWILEQARKPRVEIRTTSARRKKADLA